MGSSQPVDEWDFVRRESDDEDPGADPAAEDDAVHVTEEASGPLDPWRSDLSAEVDDGDDRGPRVHFDDEEPDGPAPADEDGRRSGDGHEPDLGEILESQHYAFAAEAGDPDTDGRDGEGRSDEVVRRP